MKDLKLFLLRLCATDAPTLSAIADYLSLTSLQEREELRATLREMSEVDGTVGYYGQGTFARFHPTLKGWQELRDRKDQTN